MRIGTVALPGRPVAFATVDPARPESLGWRFAPPAWETSPECGREPTRPAGDPPPDDATATAITTTATTTTSEPAAASRRRRARACRARSRRSRRGSNSGKLITAIIANDMSAQLGSILVPMVTPFDERGRIDEDAAVRLMHHLIDQGVDGLVLCGTTGEAATLADDEHLGIIDLAVKEVSERCKIVAGVGSNDTRHAVHLTERATALGADALLSVNPYYNRPSRRGIVRHFEEVNRATDKPIVLYNIPQRTGSDMPNDLLAELAQLEHVVAVKQSNAANLAKVDGLEIYAGNDDMFADVLDLGEPGGILVAAHLFAPELRRMVDQPERRREIDAGLQDVYRDLAVAPLACSTKAALNLLGIEVGPPRLPYVALDEQELGVIRAMLERHGLLQTTAA